MSFRRKFDKIAINSIQNTSNEILRWLLENASLNQKNKIRILRKQFEIQTLNKQIVYQTKFVCSIMFCQIFFIKTNNLFRHFKKTSNDAHIHIASIMKKRYCQSCQKRFCRQCDFWRHMRNAHSLIDLTFWKMNNKSTKILDANIIQNCIYFDLYKNDF